MHNSCTIGRIRMKVTEEQIRCLIFIYNRDNFAYLFIKAFILGWAPSVLTTQHIVFWVGIDWPQSRNEVCPVLPSQT